MAAARLALGATDETAPAIEAHTRDVLDALSQFRLDVFVDGQLARVDDRHVEPGLDGSIEKG